MTSTKVPDAPNVSRVVLELFMEPEMKEALEEIEKAIAKETGFIIPRKQITKRLYLEGVRAMGEKFNVGFKVNPI